MTSTKALLGLAALSLSGEACAPAIAPPPVAAPPTVTLVDPRIGTGGFGFGYGGAFHGAALPHGLAKAGPDTTGDFGEVRFVHTSGNWARDQTVLCFSHVHLHGAGLPEGGVVAMMPTTSFDPARVSVRDYAATRSAEVAAAGHYRVHLDEPDIDVDLASTVHGTSWQLTFPDDTDHAVVVVDLDKTIVEGEVTSREHTVLGRRIVGRLHTDGGLSPPGGYEVFFIIEGDDALVAVETSAGLALDFGPRDRDHPVRLKVALSLTDAAGAVANFDAELADAGSHADVVVTATAAWDAVLGRVRLFGGSDDEQVILASALYRSFLMPTVIADVDGRWRGPDGLHDDDDFRMMSDFSLWDTYRSVHPLYALVAPASARDAALSIAAWTLALGNGPQWTMAGGDARVMVGSPGEVVLGDAVARGVFDSVDLDTDVGAAYRVLRAAALDEAEPPNGRGGRADALAFDAAGGYVPAPARGAASTTFEYAVADQGLAELASAVGDDDTAARLTTRSQGWRQLFDPATGFVRAKDAAGAFVISAADFDPAAFSDDYVEANAWQTMFPIDDVDGSAAVYGGVDATVERLRDVLDRSEADYATRDPFADSFGVSPLPFHWQGNEPSLHVSWLAYRLGDDALGARFVDWVRRTHYRRDEAGIPGNDDGGALSAWYVEAALGLLPVAGDADWIVGAPLFPAVEIDTANGTLRIEQATAGDDGVRRADGVDIEATIDHATLLTVEQLVVGRFR